MQNTTTTGFRVHADVDKLAGGMLELIQTHPDAQCLTLGMLPAGLMESFETQMADRVPDAAACKDITHAVTVRILQLATKRGLCLV